MTSRTCVVRNDVTRTVSATPPPPPDYSQYGTSPKKAAKRGARDQLGSPRQPSADPTLADVMSMLHDLRSGQIDLRTSMSSRLDKVESGHEILCARVNSLAEELDQFRTRADEDVATPATAQKLEAVAFPLGSSPAELVSTSHILSRRHPKALRSPNSPQGSCTSHTTVEAACSFTSDFRAKPLHEAAGGALLYIQRDLTHAQRKIGYVLCGVRKHLVANSKAWYKSTPGSADDGPLSHIKIGCSSSAIYLKSSTDGTLPMLHALQVLGRSCATTSPGRPWLVVLIWQPALDVSRVGNQIAVHGVLRISSIREPPEVQDLLLEDQWDALGFRCLLPSCDLECRSSI
eukprot:6127774-Amphidinium_carterae.4